MPLSAHELRRLVERLNLAHGPRQLVIYSLLVATINWKDRLTLGHLDRENPRLAREVFTARSYRGVGWRHFLPSLSYLHKTLASGVNIVSHLYE